jgi:hypothetical protein
MKAILFFMKRCKVVKGGGCVRQAPQRRCPEKEYESLQEESKQNGDSGGIFYSRKNWRFVIGYTEQNSLKVW